MRNEREREKWTRTSMGTGGGSLPADDTPTYDTRVQSKIRLANLVARPGLPASPRPPRAAHRPAASRTPRRMPGFNSWTLVVEVK